MGKTVLFAQQELRSLKRVSGLKSDNGNSSGSLPSQLRRTLRASFRFQCCSFSLILLSRALEIDGWETRPVEEIIEENEEIFDHYSPAVRERIQDVASLPLADTAGREMRIYDAAGSKIVRRTAIPLADGVISYAGLLMDLQDIDAIFVGEQAPSRTNDNDSEDDEAAAAALALDDAPQPRSMKLAVFPQAFTGRYGHFQATSIMRTFDAPIKGVNDTFQVDHVEGQGNSIVVVGDSCQGYNELSHRTAPRAGGHDVQQGLMTASLLRGEGLSQVQQTKTQKWRDACIGALPAHRVRDKLLHEACPRAFRMEHVYMIDNWAIPMARRDGR